MLHWSVPQNQMAFGQAVLYIGGILISVSTVAFFLIYLWLVCHIRRTACKICLQSGGDLLARICVPLIVLIKP